MKKCLYERTLCDYWFISNKNMCIWYMIIFSLYISLIELIDLCVMGLWFQLKYFLQM